MNTRAIAAKILALVIRDRRSLTELFHQQLPNALADRDRGLVKEYCYGVLRWYERLKIIADLLVYKPLKARDQEITSLLLLGLYQLIYLKTPPYAALSETVAAAQTLKRPWAKGLINQALHQFLNHPEKFLERADAVEPGQFSHPQWLITLLKSAWPAHWQAILTANNSAGPMFLRVNPQQNSRDQYLQKLQQQNIDAAPVVDLPQAIYLPLPRAVGDLPGFNDGCCSVQDLASQLAAQLLDVQPQQRVLDACAAPGGKACHILEIQPDLAQLLAIDHDPDRLQRITENMERLKLTARGRLLAADAAKPETWWDGELFDRILLDAPCSGTGVIRRHPDIKILRKPDDIASYTQQQTTLLQALWPLLKVNGRLLYTTCSVFPQENEQVIQHFCQIHPDAKPQPIATNFGIAQTLGRQLFPTPQSHDGFYYALIVKVPDATLPPMHLNLQ